MTVNYKMKLPEFFITINGTEINLVCEELDPDESLVTLFHEIIENLSKITPTRVEKHTLDYIKERINLILQDKIWLGELYFHNLTNKWIYSPFKDENGNQDISGRREDSSGGVG